LEEAGFEPKTPSTRPEGVAPLLLSVNCTWQV
jgi:hypothetical protein